MRLNKRLWIILLGVIAVLLGSLLFMKQRVPAGKVVMDFSACSSSISANTQNSLEIQAYHFVKGANTYNSVSTKRGYTGVIRNGSCSTKHGDSVDTTSFIVDIAQAKQSWKITFNQLAAGAPPTDLGPITPSCVPENQLLYGNFNCTAALANIVPPSVKTDPMFDYLPHSTLDYTLTATVDSSNKTILNAQLFLTEADQADPSAALAQYKQEVVEYIQSVGLNPNSYTINYTY